MLLRMTGQIVIVMFLAGCAGTVVTPSPSVATPSPSPEPLAIAPVGSGPAIRHAELDAGFVLGAAAAHVAGVSHLWAVAFRTDPGIPPDLIHLTSNDGTTWEAGPEPVRLDGTALGINDIGPIPSSVLVDGDGTWLLYGGARRAGSDAPTCGVPRLPGRTAHGRCIRNRCSPRRPTDGTAPSPTTHRSCAPTMAT